MGAESSLVLVLGADDDGVAGDRHGAAEFIARRGVASRHLGQLGAVARAEDVGRARVAVLPGSDHDGVPIDGHGDAELVALRGVGRRQLGRRVCGPVVGRAEDVGRAHGGARGVGPGFVELRVVVAPGPGHDGVAGRRDRQGCAEGVPGAGLGGVEHVDAVAGELGHLGIRAAAVGRAVDVGRTAALVPGPHHDRTAGDRHGAAEPVLLLGVVGRQLDLRVRGPAVGRAVDVGRARGIDRVPVHGARGPYHDGVAVDRDGPAEAVLAGHGVAVGGRQLGQLDVRGAAVGRSEHVRGALLVAVAGGTNHGDVAVDRHRLAVRLLGIIHRVRVARARPRDEPEGRAAEAPAPQRAAGAMVEQSRRPVGRRGGEDEGDGAHFVGCPGGFFH